MRIIASTPDKYDNSRKLVVEMDTEELAALVALSTYSEIELTDANGKVVTRKLSKVLGGDTIAPSVFKDFASKTYDFKKSREEIDKAISTMRGAMTKLQNVMPKGNPE